MSITFEDNSDAIKNLIDDSLINFLHGIGGEFQSQTAKNSRVDTGQTKGSWDYRVDENDLLVEIGSSLENAIWEELGTGEYALEGKGRKGGWYYVDENGQGHFTRGKKPNRAFFTAYVNITPKLEKILGVKLKVALE